MNLTGQQIRTIVAAYLGWTLDAFDFFVLTFVIRDIAKEFGVEVSAVAYALFLTLAMRFVGAFIFGRIGDQLGPQAGADAGHSVLFDHRRARGLLAQPDRVPDPAGAVRRRHGRRMGPRQLAGDGVDPAADRAGSCRACCNAAIRAASCWRRSPTASSTAQTFGDYTFGWRAMFLLSVLPAFVVLFIRSRGARIAGLRRRRRHPREADSGRRSRSNRGLVIYMVVLMMCFNLFSHGTQDLYPTFLQKQHHFDPATVSWIAIVANLGAIAGGLTFGHISERIGRVNAITIAALIALPALPLWAYSTTPVMLALGAFIMQIAVQGAWGVIPAHLNELAPGAARATIPAFVYQAGNFLASYNGPFQAKIAEANGGNYGLALALVAGVVAIAIVIVIRFSPERRGELLLAH